MFKRSILRQLQLVKLAVLLTLPFSIFAQETPATDAVTTTNVPVPAETPPVASAPENPCGDHADLDKWIDRVHSDLYRLTCSTASWFDGLFGNRRYDQEYRATNGNLNVGTLWSDRDGFDKVLRFHARMYLPQLSERFHAFIGRVDRQEFVSESKGELYGLPSAFGRNLDASTLLGLGYNEPLKKRGSFDADAGVRLEFPLDPFIKGSYRYARPIGERNLLRLRETVFWENTEGVGTTAQIDFDHIITDRHLVRWSYTGTFSEISEGLRWYSTLTLYQVLSPAKQRALAYEAAVSGSTEAGAPLTDYGATVIFRQSTWRDWLVIEVRAGIDWPRYSPAEPRRANPNAGLAFELRYGNNNNR